MDAKAMGTHGRRRREMNVLVVDVDELRGVSIIPDMKDPENVWSVTARMLPEEPWYLPITSEEIAALFTVPVEVETLPANKYPFATKFLVRRKES